MSKEKKENADNDKHYLIDIHNECDNKNMLDKQPIAVSQLKINNHKIKKIMLQKSIQQ